MLTKGGIFSNCEGSYVLNVLYMTCCNSIISDIIYRSYGATVLIDLAGFGKLGRNMSQQDGSACVLRKDLLH